MSSDPSSSQQLIIGLRTIQIANNIQISTTVLSQLSISSFATSSALFFYDIIITFDQEIRVVWTRKITAASVIYILSRYLMFLYLILTFVENAFDCEVPFNRMFHLRIVTHQSSYIVIQFYNSVQCILYAIWAALTPLAFTALRTYAISLHAWHVAALVFLLGMVPAGVNSYYYSQMQLYNLPPPTGCILASTIPNDIMNKTYGLRKAANEVHVRASLASMLLRDGTIYFGFSSVLFLLSLADIILSVTDTFSDTTTFIAILTPMLLARFFLNLRQIDNSGHGTGTSSQGETYQASNLRFAASIFGNMGQSLGIGGEETDGDLDLELTTDGSSESNPDSLMTEA
ncbi:uncharacterized protein LAESUDRAFT_718093 [Laetiporus sulphureus 93-53]|uniref:DUF6533 domain-containing protein n=1 Tax=Laetiporus sulphureus 93-53 TaxID=1314785 RepID=A0A165B9G5_9APHY|nr:uncharacterized protein LAESUDRAFT_718093 [Laetiporus sulphureus 93-53]KZT00553.1 hypothetical protein LAESUDRAFT_718093 [Laetiporus sulphureus 93-53]